MRAGVNVRETNILKKDIIKRRMIRMATKSKNKHTKSNFKKNLRNMSPDEMKKTYNDLKIEYAKVYGNPVRGQGGLGKDAMKPRNIRKQIAQLLTIARERGVEVGSVWNMKKDKANLKLRI